MTNTPPNGAFRAFGAPQTQFAGEVHMDRIAEQIGIDPVRLREINRAPPRRHDGHWSAAGARHERAAGACARPVKRTDFKRRRRTIARENARLVGASGVARALQARVGRP